MKSLYFLVLISFYFFYLSTEKVTGKIYGYFPPNLTDVTWAHATNSIATLAAAIANPEIMMLEADILMGYVIGSDEPEKIPIMAHGPVIYSDLSFEMFLQTVMQFNEATEDLRARKGMKLDFKGVEAIEPVLQILVANDASNFEFPVWFNADILKGPIEATSTPVDAEIFLSLTTTYLPEATLSTGWKTRYEEGYLNGSYTIEHANEMIDMLLSQNVNPLTPITYPIRAGLGTQSISQIVYLLDRSEMFWGNSSITIWNGGEDPPLDQEQLRLLVDTVGRHRCFVDLPFDV